MLKKNDLNQSSNLNFKELQTLNQFKIRNLFYMFNL